MAGWETCSPRENRDETVAGLIGSQDDPVADGAREAAQKRLDAAKAKLRRLTAAIEAGAEPAALVESINDAQEARLAAEAELASSRLATGLDVRRGLRDDRLIG